MKIYWLILDEIGTNWKEKKMWWCLGGQGRLGDHGEWFPKAITCRFSLLSELGIFLAITRNTFWTISYNDGQKIEFWGKQKREGKKKNKKTKKKSKVGDER